MDTAKTFCEGAQEPRDGELHSSNTVSSNSKPANLLTRKHPELLRSSPRYGSSSDPGVSGEPIHCCLAKPPSIPSPLTAADSPGATVRMQTHNVSFTWMPLARCGPIV
ncbi:hypothetical protein NDU88_004008 [Pleurodeles waltl]|uniref:Uncharacterized protein n=1 Tax=Pleurodeles waltl TaxID=8319 RepID=A0AAV7T6R4_PLEWA|nr:hypothetical protein NDU88_004008 [Pleurodeles waltl]